jgi:hypothetical protein
MDALLAAIASTGNIAILVLMVVLIGAWRLLRDEREADRKARADDSLRCAEATERQTQAVNALTTVLADLRVEIAKKGAR